MAFIEVFRSRRKAETYLYLPKGYDQSELPEVLTRVFGEPELVLGLDLTPERQLARYQGGEILEAIAAQGFFLQMPEGEREADSC